MATYAYHTNVWDHYREMITCDVCKSSMQRITYNGVHKLSMKHLKAVNPNSVFADGCVKLPSHIDCSCGVRVSRSYHKQHLKTAKHLKGPTVARVPKKTVLCLCGSTVSKHCHRRHLKTAKHRRGISFLRARDS